MNLIALQAMEEEDEMFTTPEGYTRVGSGKGCIILKREKVSRCSQRHIVLNNLVGPFYEVVLSLTTRSITTKYTYLPIKISFG